MLPGLAGAVDTAPRLFVDTEGECAEVSSGWSGATLLTVMNGSLWIVHSGTLYRVEPEPE
jgi:hypothetical protein